MKENSVSIYYTFILILRNKRKDISSWNNQLYQMKRIVQNKLRILYFQLYQHRKVQVISFRQAIAIFAARNMQGMHSGRSSIM